MSETLGRYRLLSPLATGGMGEVFLARQEGPAGFAKTVVVKRILRHLASDQGFVDLFVNEARLAAQLQHPHVAQVFGLEHEGNAWFIAMEYVHGRSLRQVLDACRARGQALPPQLAVRLVAQALEGLHYAHELTDGRGRALGILHRDVTPENLLVAFAGVVKLVDFGIAKAMSDAGARVGRPRGKIPYMAPELTVPGATVDRRADVYAAGVVLHEALTLSLPPQVPTTREEAARPRGRLGATERLPGGLGEVLARALEPEPAARFQTAGAMAAALESWLTASGQTVMAADITDFLAGLFGRDALEANAGVALGRASKPDHPLQPGTQPLTSQKALGPVASSLAVLKPVEAAVAASPAHPAELAAAPRPTWWSRRSMAVAGALVVLGVLVGAWWAATRAPTALPEDAASIPFVESGPDDLVIPEVELLPGADVVTDGAPGAATPAPPARTPAKKTARPGRVTLRVGPGVEVLFGGKSYGVTPLPPLEVPPGIATFTLRSAALGVTRRVSVKVPPGGSVVLKADLRAR